MAKKEKSIWIPTSERFVSFIDILGFKERVMRSKHIDVYNSLIKISKIREYIELINKEIEEKYKNAEILSISFSDSIILFSKNNTPEDYDLIIWATSKLIAQSIENEMPLKGAIAFGEISVNQSSQVYFGQPLIDAYLLEEEVQYFGVIAHHSLVEYYYKNKSKIEASSHLFEAITPLKCGQLTHTNLNWIQDLETQNGKGFKSIFVKLMKNYKITTSGSARKYVDNTITLFRSRYKLPETI